MTARKSASRVGDEAPGSVPGITSAMALTLRSIEARTRLYRGLVIAVCVVSVLAIVLTIVLRSWIPLLGFSLLVPLAGAYLLLDGRRVRNWQMRIFELWRRHDLKLSALAKSLTAHPSVPRRTVEGMLSALPGETAGIKLDTLSDLQKQRLIAESSAVWRKQELRTVLAVMALTLAAGLAAAAAQFRSGRALVCAALVVVTWAAVKNRL